MMNDAAGMSSKSGDPSCSTLESSVTSVTSVVNSVVNSVIRRTGISA